MPQNARRRCVLPCLFAYRGLLFTPQHTTFAPSKTKKNIMAVFYKLIRNNNTRNPRAYGKWYARATHPETVEIEQLAEKIQANCTLKESDIVAVLSELVYTMTHELQASRSVRLRGLGTFKIGLNSKGVDHPDDFRPDQDIVDMHVLFHPETHVGYNHQRRRALLQGTKVRPLPVK